MTLNDPLPEEHGRFYAELSGGPQPPSFCCQADLDAAQRFAASWVAVDPQRVVVFTADAAPLNLPLAALESVKIEEHFGCSQLIGETEEGRVVLARYSRNLVGEIAALCRVINDLREDRQPVLPDELEQAACTTCQAPLPERGATCPLCLSRRGIALRLIEMLRPYRWQALLLVTCSNLAVLCHLVIPSVYKFITDRVLLGEHKEELGMWIGIMLAALVADNAFRFATNWVNAWLGPRIITDMRSRLHAHAQRLHLRYHNRHDSGQLIGRIMNDTAELEHFIVDGLPYFLVNSVQFIAIAVILTYYDWRLALMVFLPVPMLLGGGTFFWKRLRPIFHKRGHRIGSLHSILGESLNGVRAVKSMAQERRRAGQFDKRNERVLGVEVVLARTFHSFFATMSLTMAAGTILVWYFGGLAILEKDPARHFQLGTLLAFVGYMAMFYGPLQWFSAVFNWMNNALTAAERIFAVLDQPAEVHDSPDAIRLPAVRGDIELRDIRFSYERGSEVIKGIDLHIPAGTMIGLVGRSGAGKSTIINLVCRFYDPDSGVITIDGHELRALDLSAWRQQVGIVMQDSFLFQATILENIRYGKPQASVEDVVDAARSARAHEFICAKEEGYDTLIGDGGASLSGGERQRIAIARAILHDPPVLILDEATSAVDSQTEKQIQEAIANLVRGRTTIAIAHRLATLRNADRLVVIEDGRIVEQGTHQELMAMEDGHFANLVKLQSDINKLRAEQDTWQQ